MAHRNIPVFIPHLGCPHQCVFCNQRSISEQSDFSIAQVDQIICRALSTIPVTDEVEIAFFGGSFTGIERSLMVSLLEIAQKYVNEGRVNSIRLSTRPDYISNDILDLLSAYSVKTIELGLQSMSNKVLEASGRGHSVHDAVLACRAVVERGFDLVGQMMIGLPQSSPRDELETAEQICRLGATAARIYPTVVFYETPLAELTSAGIYEPLSLADAVRRSADVLEVFLENGVECIRIGLCATESLTSDEKVMAGPNHAALGELVWNEYYYKKLSALVRATESEGKEITLSLPSELVSKVVGQHRSNIKRLLREYGTTVKKSLKATDAHGISILPERGVN